MILQLNNLGVDCVIGERAEERQRTQSLRVNVELVIDDKVAQSDCLGDTVDYAALTDRIRRALVDAKCQMIERAAKIVADVCCADDKVRHVKAKVTKSGAVMHLESASAIYEEAR